jgi:serine/threonine-protein kinase
MRWLQLRDALGSGTFGTVYRGELIGATGVRRAVAVKVMTRGHQDSELFLTRIRDEARLLGMLQDESILEVLDLLTLDGRDTVVMEYVDGVDLENLLKAGRRPPPRALAAFGAVVAGALHKAHIATDPVSGAPLGVVHRDVKPANVMLTARGGIKLLDFGVAKAAFEARESQTGQMVLGTLNYMAPEYIVHGTLGPAVDLWGLGLTLIEAAGGVTYGQPKLRPQQADARREELLARLGPEWKALADPIRAMLAWDPAARPQGAELERWLLDVSDASAGASLPRWCAENVSEFLAARGPGEDREGLAGRLFPLDSAPEPTARLAPAPAAPREAAVEPTTFDRPPPPPAARTVQPRTALPPGRPPARSSGAGGAILKGLAAGGCLGFVMLTFLVAVLLVFR